MIAVPTDTHVTTRDYASTVPVPSRVNVCIIDDDPDLREVLSRVVKSVGLSCQLFESSETFLEERTLATDCVVVSLQLRGIDPVEFVEHLLQSRRRLPVFMVGTDGAALVAASRLKGAIVVEKPFDARVLARRIRTAVDGANVDDRH